MNRLLIILFLLSLNIKVYAQWTTLCNNGNGFVTSSDTFNNELYATGFFTSLCGNANSHVAKYDGSTWQAVGNGFSNAGHQIKNINGTLYGVAYQPAIDSNWVYKFDGTNFNKLGEGVYLSNAVVGFSKTANLYNIIEYNGNLVVCGEFDRVGNKFIKGIAKWNGTSWDSLGTGLSGNIPSTAPVMYPHDMCNFGGDLIVSGNFLSAGGQTVKGIARWDGTQWHPMGQGFNSTVYALAVYNGELYAGGDFTMSGTTTIKYIAKWNGTAWVDPGFSVSHVSMSNYTFVHTLKVINAHLVIAGGFDRVKLGTNTYTCQAITAYDGVGFDLLAGGITGNEVEAVSFFNNELYAGGGANNSNGLVAKYSIPLFSTTIKDKSLDVNIFPNPTDGVINVQSNQEIDNIRISNIYGQQILNINPKNYDYSFELNEQGIYFVSIKVSDKITSKKIIVNK